MSEPTSCVCPEDPFISSLKKFIEPWWPVIYYAGARLLEHVAFKIGYKAKDQFKHKTE